MVAAQNMVQTLLGTDKRQEGRGANTSREAATCQEVSTIFFE
jgi:hypothetical protein